MGVVMSHKHFFSVIFALVLGVGLINGSLIARGGERVGDFNAGARPAGEQYHPQARQNYDVNRDVNRDLNRNAGNFEGGGGYGGGYAQPVLVPPVDMNPNDPGSPNYDNFPQ